MPMKRWPPCARGRSLKAVLKERSPVIGSFLTYGDAGVAETMAHAGFDFLVLDLEHTLVGPEQVAHFVRACEAAGTSAIVRVPSVSTPEILGLLDAGVEGIMVPHVDSVETARRIVAAAYFAPLGERGIFGASRAAGYSSRDLGEYLDDANDRTVVFALVEEAKGMKAVGEILAVPGIDSVIVGPFDLSNSFGFVGEIEHPQLVGAVTEFFFEVNATQKATGGIFVGSVEHGRRWLDAGADVLIYSCDAMLLYDACREAVGALQRVAQNEVPLHRDGTGI